MTTTTKLYSLEYADIKTYIMAVLFVAGNIILPQLCHLIPQGGLIWLPIYFFTLVGAYKYGWRVGLITAIASPLINSILFGMPAVGMLPVILLKSIILALTASYCAYRYKSVSLLLFCGIIVCYQTLGSIGEWIITGSLSAALQDIKIGIPGLLTQIIGGWFVIKYIIKR